MDQEQAREALVAERKQLLHLLKADEGAEAESLGAAQEAGDLVDPAGALTELEMDEAVAKSLRERLGAIERALKRLGDGTYGRSILSGTPIPDERMEADPAAELTVEEAKQQRT